MIPVTSILNDPFVFVALFLVVFTTLVLVMAYTLEWWLRQPSRFYPKKK